MPPNSSRVPLLAVRGIRAHVVHAEATEFYLGCPDRQLENRPPGPFGVQFAARCPARPYFAVFKPVRVFEGEGVILALGSM